MMRLVWDDKDVCRFIGYISQLFRHYFHQIITQYKIKTSYNSVTR